MIGGGFDGDSAENIVSYSRKVANGWAVIATNFSSISATITADAVCVSGPGIQAVRGTRADDRSLTAAVDRVRATLPAAG